VIEPGQPDASRTAIVASPGARLKIVHVTNYQVPGYGYDEIQLAREQHRMGHDVTIITSNYLHPSGLYSILRRRFPQRRVEPRDEVVDGVLIRRLAGREIARRVWIRGLEKALVELSPDVIHSHNVLQFHSARIATLRATGRIHAAVVIDDHMHFGFVRRTVAGRLFYAAYRALGQPILSRYVDSFCAIADDTRAYLQSECGVKGEIHVVPLGVTTRGAADPGARAQMRRQIGVADSDLVLIYAGKVIPEKGVDLLVEAASRLRADGARVTVVAVGDSDEEYERRLTALAAAGAGVDLHLVPSVDQDRLVEWFAAADVGVWPQQESKAVFEAMAAGLPVVVSASSGLAHLVVPDRGLTYEAQDVEALTARLRELTDASLRKRLGGAGRDYAISELSWTRSAERYVEIYRDAIAQRARGGSNRS
jgi:glycosyltransferase involved in cell wall biosynthesis